MEPIETGYGRYEVNLQRMTDDQDIDFTNHMEPIDTLKICPDEYCLTKPVFNIYISTNKFIKDILIKNCTVAGGVSIFRTSCDTLTMESVTVSGLNVGIDVRHAKMVNLMNVTTLQGFNVDVYKGCRTSLLSCHMPYGNIVSHRRSRDSESLSLHNVVGLTRLDGPFTQMSITASDLSQCEFYPIGKLNTAYGTIGDGTYIKSITHKGFLFTYSSDKLWVSYTGIGSRYKICDASPVSLSDLAIGDGFTEIEKRIRGKTKTIDLTAQLPLSAIIDMILDDPAKVIPETD